MNRINKHAFKIFIAAAAVAIIGGALAIFVPRITANSGKYTGETVAAKVFFGSSKLDPELDCTKVFPTERQVPKNEDMVRGTLQALLQGPSYPEEQTGYFSSLNHSIELNSVNVRNNVAYADFNGTLVKDIEGTCRDDAIRAEITQTLLQFSNIKSVVITVDGKKEGILGQ